MKTLLGTQLIAQSTADAKAIKASHRATTWPQIRTLGYAYNEALRSAGLTPYSYLWPLDLDTSPVKMTTGRMDSYWNGQAYVLPDKFRTAINAWAGHPLMAQHIGGVWGKDETLTLFGVGVDADDWIAKASLAYAAMFRALREAGADPYVFIDEPSVAADVPLDKQLKAARYAHRIALACQEAGNILVRAGGTPIPCGPALTPAQLAAWNALGTPWTWLVVKLQSVIEGTKWQTGGWATAAGDREVWFYTTSDRRFLPGHEAEMAAIIAWAKAVMGATGYLNWTVYPIASRPQDSGLCFGPGVATATFDPTIHPLPKLAALGAAIAEPTVPPPPPPPVVTPPTLENIASRVVALEAQVSRLNQVVLSEIDAQ